MNSKVNLNTELAHLFIETFLIKDQNPYRLVQILHYLELRGEDLHKFYIVFALFYRQPLTPFTRQEPPCNR